MGLRPLRLAADVVLLALTPPGAVRAGVMACVGVEGVAAVRGLMGALGAGRTGLLSRHLPAADGWAAGRASGGVV